MAADIREVANSLLIIAGLAIWSVSSANELDQISETEVIAYLKHEAEVKLSALNRRIVECNEIRDATRLTVTPVEVLDVFRNAGLSRSQALYAVMFLGEQNKQRCMQREAADLAYALNAMDRLNGEADPEVRIASDDAEYAIGQLRDLVTTGGLDSYRIAIFYSRLPSSIIKFMDDSFGTAPFHALPFASALPR